MDILYLIPSISSPCAIAALTHPENLKHVRDAQQLVEVLPDSVPKSCRTCICISIPVDCLSSWTFKISSNVGADVYLPVEGSQTINLTFVYALLLEDPLDEPSLLLRDWSGDESCKVEVCDPMNSKELLDLRERVCGGTRYLQKPNALVVGDYKFSIVHPVHGQNKRLIRQISHTVAGNNLETQWRSIDLFLGEGASGSVELVRGMRTGALRAFKTIRLHGDIQRKCAEREIKIIQELQHENIIRCFQTQETSGRTGALAIDLIMQACHGDLMGLIQSAIARPHVHIMMKQVASALAYIHRKGYLHRDIKPENIMFRMPGIGEDGYADPYKDAQSYLDIPLHFYIGDFGLSRSVASGRMSCFVGTREFMAPELSHGSYTAAVDIYALGVTLMDVLDHENFDQTIARYSSIKHLEQLTQDLQDIAAAKSRLPSRTWALIRRMIDSEASIRPTAEDTRISAGELLQEQHPELERLIAVPQVSCPSASRPVEQDIEAHKTRYAMRTLRARPNLPASIHSPCHQALLVQERQCIRSLEAKCSEKIIEISSGTNEIRKNVRANTHVSECRSRVRHSGNILHQNPPSLEEKQQPTTEGLGYPEDIPKESKNAQQSQDDGKYAINVSRQRSNLQTPSKAAGLQSTRDEANFKRRHEEAVPKRNKQGQPVFGDQVDIPSQAKIYESRPPSEEAPQFWFNYDRSKYKVSLAASKVEKWTSDTETLDEKYCISSKSQEQDIFRDMEAGTKITWLWVQILEVLRNPKQAKSLGRIHFGILVRQNQSGNDVSKERTACFETRLKQWVAAGMTIGLNFQRLEPRRIYLSA